MTRPKPVARPGSPSSGRKACSTTPPRARPAALLLPLKKRTSLKPQVATLTDSAPPGSDWLLEIKFDGYRALCRIDKGAARLYTRAGNDWTAKWRDIATAAAELPVKQAWLDGEVVAIDRDGKVSIQLLQN